jgi:hypothetical protein
MKDQILNVQIHTRVSMRWMRMVMVKIVMMKIDAKASKIQVAIAVDSLCEPPSKSLMDVRFHGDVVSLYLQSLI